MRCARCGWASAWPSRSASAVAVVLRLVDNELPQREQEGLETIVALVAVAMVTYMIVWMTEHARDLKGQLQEQAAGALAQGSARALVAMAFLAVLREGFETAVFLLAAFKTRPTACRRASASSSASRWRSRSATGSTAAACA